jgi:hypothetical protein
MKFAPSSGSETLNLYQTIILELKAQSNADAFVVTTFGQHDYGISIMVMVARNVGIGSKQKANTSRRHASKNS